jgi:ABC-type Mn2+/Zn2+ transport system ATPase subunit
VTSDPDEVLVAAHGLAVGYGSTPTVRGIELAVRRGEIWFVCGPNGAGKSCLS